MWKKVKLGDLCEILDTRRKPITKKNRIHGEYPYYGATGIVDWVADYIFDEELVLIGEDGAKWDAGEKTAFIVDGKYWVNNHAHVVKPNTEKLLNKWLTYYLCGIDLKPWVTGMTVPKLNQGQLKSIPIPLPPLAEQERIIAKLDAAFAEIESLNKIASIRKAELAKLKKALLLKTLSSEKSDLINLGDVCELIYGKGLDKIYRLENDGIPAYGANGIKAYSTKILSDEPSIIIGRKGSAGELTRVYSAFWALDVTYYTKINKKLIDLDFLYYTLSSMDLPSMAKGVKPGINRNDVYKRLIHLPTLEEQKHIVSILDEAYIAIEKVNDLVSKLKNNCDALQTAILKQELQPSEAA